MRDSLTSPANGIDSFWLAMKVIVVAVETLLDVIETEQNSIQAKIDDLGDQWDRTNTTTMSHPGDWRVNQPWTTTSSTRGPTSGSRPASPPS